MDAPRGPRSGRQSLLRSLITASFALTLSANAFANSPEDFDTAAEEIGQNTQTVPAQIGDKPWILSPSPNVIVPEDTGIKPQSQPQSTPNPAGSFPASQNPVEPAAAGAQDYIQALDHYEAGRYAQALSFAKTSGDQGNANGALLAGYLMKTGLTGQKLYSEAVSYYEISARAGNSDAMVALGEMGALRQGGLNGRDAKDWLTKAARLGRTDAVMALAEIEIKGIDIAPNPNAGRDWLIVALDKGEPRAARKLGDLYIDSEPNTALAYYEKAAELGDGQAAYIAAVMYAENLSIRPNEKRAAELMSQAANAGVPGAMADYGLLVFQGAANSGLSKEQRMIEAAQWFEKSAKVGDDQGKFFWAYSLAKGDGVEQNLEDAYFWILQTRPSGIPDYDKDLVSLRKALEAQADPGQLARARSRAGL